MRKKIDIFGSTGSIGTQTLEIVRNNPDLFEVEMLTCGANVDLLNQQIEEFNPKLVGIANKNQKDKIKEKANITYAYGESEIIELINRSESKMVVMGISGASGLLPTMKAIENKKDIALATKEVMVMAGEIVNKEIKKYGVNLMPVDSEHSAIWQSLHSGKHREIEKIILTCSGGPFRNKTKEELEKVTVADALNHPNWSMGKRITIDSSTLFNKALEVIEAKWLFDIEAEKIEVVVHPQSILHSAVQFVDGSVIGQMGLPDMKLPIQIALAYPERIKNNFPRLSFFEKNNLTFEKPDIEKFPCLKYGYEAIKIGGTMPTVFNASDEILVANFLEEKIKYLDISKIIKQVMEAHKTIFDLNIENILEADSWARTKTQEIVDNLV